MVVVNENKPDDIREIMKLDGFESSVSHSRLQCNHPTPMGGLTTDFFFFPFLLQHLTDCQDSSCRKREAVYS